MVNDDPKILKPLKSLTEKLESIVKYLAYFDLVVEKLRELAPFKKEDARKIRGIIRGGLLTPTRRNLIKLGRLINEVGGEMEFYPQFGGKVTPGSLYAQLKTYWSDKSERGKQRRVCLATIESYLGFNQEGLVMASLRGNPADQISKEQLAGLRKNIAGLIGVINATKNDVEHLRSQYKHLGIHKSVF